MPTDQGAWQVLMENSFLFFGLTPDERHRLRQLAELFLNEKNLDPVGGLILDEGKRLLLAAQACLPILHLGLDYYDNWITLILYPKQFTPWQSEVDPIGVVHAPKPRIGEAWPNGPVILSWKDVERDLRGDWDYPMNVIIHELCHQLDVRHGGFDGMPLLHPQMNPKQWIRDFSAAFAALRRADERHQETFIDPYAGESPAEFFAVVCETFFVAPNLLAEGYPEIYTHLCHYFRQSPLARMHYGRS